MAPRDCAGLLQRGLPMRWLPMLLIISCSLTPIPDVTSNYVDPCDTAQRVCPVAFTLKAVMERSVELRGDFRDAGWSEGIGMERVNDAWNATLQVPWGATVQYKYFVDGNRWIRPREHAVGARWKREHQQHRAQRDVREVDLHRGAMMKTDWGARRE